MNAAPQARKVAIITGASRGIGAGLVAGYRKAGYAVVGLALSMSPSDEEDYLAIHGDITEAETAQRVVDHPLDRFDGSTPWSTTRGSTSVCPSPTTQSMTISRSPR